MIALTLVLSGCGAKIERAPDAVEPLAEENVALRNEPGLAAQALDGRIGYIQKIALALYEKGTHVLLSSNGESANLVCLLESTKLDLNAYEGQQVEVKGKLSQLNDSGVLIMQVEDVISITEKQQANVLEELRRLARAYDPPYNFTVEDKYQVVSHSEEAGTMNVKVIQGLTAELSEESNVKAYLVKMLRRGEVASGTWEIYEIKETEYTAQILEDDELEAGLVPADVDAPLAGAEDETTTTPADENSESTDELTFGEDLEASVPAKEVKVIAADDSVSTEALNLITKLENELGTVVGASNISNIYRVDLVAGNLAYVYYKQGDDYKMALLSSADGTLSKVALFQAGEETDWEKVEGDNLAKAKAATVYKKGDSGWEKKGELKDSWRFYENSAYQLQVPYYWYYRLRGGNIDFSDSSVSNENVLLSIDLTDYTAALAQNSYTAEENLVVGELSGVQRTYEDGSVKAILKNTAGQGVVVSVKSAAKHILEDVLSVLQLKD